MALLHVDVVAGERASQDEVVVVMVLDEAHLLRPSRTRDGTPDGGVVRVACCVTAVKTREGKVQVHGDILHRGGGANVTRCG